MTEGDKKYRRHNKIYELPEIIRDNLDDMLKDTSLSYVQISEWLKNEGFDISKSTIGRYALETHKLANKLIETREQVRELIKLAKDSDGENMAEGAMQIAAHKLTEKIAIADTEIDDMDITEAIKLTNSIARTKAYKDKIYADLKTDYAKAFEQYKKQINEELKNYPDVAERLREIANETFGRVVK